MFKTIFTQTFFAVCVIVPIQLDAAEGSKSRMIGGKERNNVIVVFDPYVSILDKDNRYRYNISDILPMVRTIATEFDKVLIDFSGYGPNDLRKSIFSCPSTVATYNHQIKTESARMEVWLSVFQFDFNLFENNLHWLSFHTLLSDIADKANRIENGTVTTILYPAVYLQSLFLQQNKTIQESFKVFRRNYKLGVVIKGSACSTDDFQLIETIQPEIILLDLHDLDWSKEFLQRCNVRNAGKFIDIAYMFHTSDTPDYGEINMTRLVTKWNCWRNAAEKNGITVVISKAFDTPYNNGDYSSDLFYRGGVHYRRTEGLWRLKENAEMGNHVFENKLTIANQFDREENMVDTTKFGMDRGVKLDYVGVIIDVVDKQILVKTIGKFKKVVLIMSSNEVLARGVKLIEKVGTEMVNLTQETEIILLMPPNAIVDANKHATFFSNPLGRWRRRAFIFNFDTKGSLRQGNSFIPSENDYLNGPVIEIIKFGYSFPLSYCYTFPIKNDPEKPKLISTLRESDVVVFHFAEEADTVMLGARRMFDERVVQFQECKRHIELLDIQRDQVDLTFVLLHYAHPPQLYTDPLAIYNFVLYWKMLTEWAEMTKTTVIMNNAVDSRREYNGTNKLELGWWRVISDDDAVNAVEFVDKEMELRQMLGQSQQEKEEEDTALSTAEIILIICGILFVILIAVFAVAFIVLYRHLKKNRISSQEIKDFFHGTRVAEDESLQNGNKNVQSVPYDKSRFEIGAKYFSIDESKLLGSGEFGLVCAAKVEKPEGIFTDTAVKMVNTVKFHKSTMTGLLSEVKVLAYLGKHENLIELIGASTSELKHGKIFVFLELCQLGSLEKYLRSICPPAGEGTEDIETENGIEMAEMSNYANAIVERLNVLDPSLSQNLYRWSREICNGMSFLASKHVVHADLATRNVLLTLEKTAKICDFGLSRRMYNYQNYVKRHLEPLPWKWMPPESLRRMEFNEKSDVWSYGVTLWEIYSLGDTPYPGLSWAPNFFQMLERGFRMSKPRYCDENMYSIIVDCWKKNPMDRPTFEALICRF